MDPYYKEMLRSLWEDFNGDEAAWSNYYGSEETQQCLQQSTY